MKQNARRLVNHLLKTVNNLKRVIVQTKEYVKVMKEMRRDESMIVILNGKATPFSFSESYGDDATIFFTSTPKQPKFFPRKYFKEPPDKPHSGLQQVTV